MARYMLDVITAAALALAAPWPAAARGEPPRDAPPFEARFGVAAHNVRFGGSGDQSHEGGVNIELEAVGGRIEALHFIWRPRPYAMVSVNTQGDTSFAAAGIYWRWNFAHDWALEPGFGFAIHDGAARHKYPPGDPREDIYEREHQQLGTRVLFRDTLAVERRLTERQSIAVYIEHLSNGGSLFGHESNQSLNEAGVRFQLGF